MMLCTGRPKFDEPTCVKACVRGQGKPLPDEPTCLKYVCGDKEGPNIKLCIIGPFGRACPPFS